MADPRFPPLKLKKRLTPSEQRYFSEITDSPADRRELHEAGIRLSRDGKAVYIEDEDRALEYIDSTYISERRPGGPGTSTIPPSFRTGGRGSFASGIVDVAPDEYVELRWAETLRELGMRTEREREAARRAAMADTPRSSGFKSFRRGLSENETVEDIAFILEENLARIERLQEGGHKTANEFIFGAVNDLEDLKKAGYPGYEEIEERFNQAVRNLPESEVRNVQDVAELESARARTDRNRSSRRAREETAREFQHFLDEYATPLRGPLPPDPSGENALTRRLKYLREERRNAADRIVRINREIREGGDYRSLEPDLEEAKAKYAELLEEFRTYDRGGKTARVFEKQRRERAAKARREAPTPDLTPEQRRQKQRIDEKEEELRREIHEQERRLSDLNPDTKSGREARARIKAARAALRGLGRIAAVATGVGTILEGAAYAQDIAEEGPVQGTRTYVGEAVEGTGSLLGLPKAAAEQLPGYGERGVNLPAEALGAIGRGMGAVGRAIAGSDEEEEMTAVNPSAVEDEAPPTSRTMQDMRRQAASRAMERERARKE